MVNAAAVTARQRRRPINRDFLPASISRQFKAQTAKFKAGYWPPQKPGSGQMVGADLGVGSGAPHLKAWEWGGWTPCTKMVFWGGRTHIRRFGNERDLAFNNLACHPQL